MMDAIGLYKRSSAGFVARVHGVRPKDWSRAPCTDWDVRALVHHVVEEQRYRTVLDPDRSASLITAVDSYSLSTMTSHRLASRPTTSIAASFGTSSASR